MKNVIYFLSGLAFAGAVVLSVQTTRAQSPVIQPTIMTEQTRDQDAVLVRMTALFTQNSDLLSETMRNQYSDSADGEASVQALRTNSQQISQLISAEFGPEKQDEFDDYWTESVTQFLNYAEGLQQDDEQRQNEALIGLHRNIIQGSQIISEETNLPQETVDEALRAHVNNLRQVIESYHNGQYAESYSQQILAQEQISQVAQALTDAWLQ